MKKRKISVVLGVIWLAMILIALPLTVACAAPPSSEYEIEIYGGKVGMSSYIAAIALAELINENSSWLRATSIESPSLIGNTKLLVTEPQRRKNTLIMTNPKYVWQAREGMEPFLGKYDKLRFIATTGFFVAGFVTLDPDIRTVADFRDKKVAIDERSSVPRVTMYKYILESAGIWDEVDLQYLGIQAGANALRDGLIDVTIGAASLMSLTNEYTPVPFLAELISTKTVYYISMDSKDITYMSQKMGPVEIESVIPAGNLGPSQTEPWTVTGTVAGWAADSEMPDDVVYEVCRIIYENADKFKEYSVALTMVSQETMANWGLPEADIHPGALKLYKEKGLEIGSY
ncbi:TAXI family TRAP transporter solute-binding subunit [Chloroflexota bacterium]